MRRRILRALSAVMSVVMLVFSGVTPFSAAAVGESDTIDVGEILHVIAENVTINGSAITDDMKVNNGDSLSLDFKWEIDSNYDGDIVPPVTMKYDMSSQLKNVSINADEMYAGGNPPTAKYKVEGQYMYITLFEGSSGRSGSCNLSGTLNVNSSDINSEDKFPIKLFDKSFTLVADPGLSINKSAAQELRTDGEKLYQDFTVTVKSETGFIDANNVTVKDFYPTDNSVYTGGILNPQIKVGDSAAQTISVEGGVFNIGTVPKDKQVELTYSIEIDKNAVINASQNSNLQTYNKAELYKDGERCGESTAYPDIRTPKIEKSRELSADKRSVTWTIKVFPGVLKDSDFSVADTLEGGLTFSDGQVSKAIAKSEFTRYGNMYEYKYTTAIPEEYLNSESLTLFTNKAKVHFDETGKEWETAATYGSYVDKKYTSVSGDTLSWETRIFIPNDTELEKVTFTDDSSTAYSPYGSHALVAGSFEITDGNGSPASCAAAADIYDINGRLISDSFELIGGSGMAEDVKYIRFVFKDEFVNANKGKIVTVKYKTKIADENTSSLVFKNIANLYLEYRDNTKHVFSDIAEYTNEITAEKSKDNINTGDLVSDTSGIINPMPWRINVYANTHTYQSTDIITITDTIPDGLYYIDGSAKLGISNNKYYAYYGDPGNQSFLNAEQNGNILTFTIALDGMIDGITLAEKISASGGYHISVAYATGMDADYASELYLTGGNTTVPFKNEAIVKLNDDQVAKVSATNSVTVTSEDTLDKRLSGSVTVEGKVYADYVIDVNKQQIAIGNISNRLTVTDTLGSRLELVGEPTVIPGEGVSDYSYDPATGRIKYTLDNGKYYQIKYRVLVNQIGRNDTTTDTDEGFTNSVLVEGADEVRKGDSILLPENIYRSTADYVFDENKAYIELSGSKLWSNEANSSLVPAKVTVVIKRTKNGSPDADYEKTYLIQPDELGNWKFESGSLLTKDADGTVYAYNVSEVEVEGYTASYKLDGSVISGGDYIGGGVVNAAPQRISFDITNTYTPELGSLTVNKVWAGESAAKPSKITITLTGDDGSSYTKDITVAGTGDQTVFTDIPLKKYSVNSSGEIVSVPVSYKITESATDDDAAILANYTLKYNGVEVTEVPVTVTAAGETVTITNEYNSPAPATGSLTVIKAWEGLTADAVIPGQLIISLYGDGVLVDSKTMNTATENSVIFDNLPINNAGGNAIAYHISESATGDDAAILANYTLKYNGVEVTEVPVTVTAAGAAVTITNEYNAPAPATGSLTVTKSWSYTNGISAKPDRLTINLYGDGVLVESKAIDVAAGESSVTFSNLPIKNAVGSDIVYHIAESAAGADAAILAEYTLKYNGTAMEQVPVTVSELGSSVAITNAYTPVLGKLTVNKVWSNITTDTVKPSEITITLYDLSGNSYVKTINIAGGETSAVFENLPVYKYSVNADNTVTKTPIKYYVIETASGDNAAILANFTAEYPGTDDTVSGKRIFDLECEDYNKAVDILNTYNGGGTGSSSSGTTTASDTTTTTTTTTASDTTTTTTTTTASDTTTTTTTTTASDTTTTTTTTPESSATTPQSSVTPPSTIPVGPVITTTTTTAVTTTTTTTTTAATTPETTERTTNTTRPPEEDEDEIETEEEIEEIPEEDDDDYSESGETDLTSTGITDEENPNTGIVLNWQLLASAVFAAAAILPQRKKKK